MYSAEVECGKGSFRVPLIVPDYIYIYILIMPDGVDKKWGQSFEIT